VCLYCLENRELKYSKAKMYNLLPSS